MPIEIVVLLGLILLNGLFAMSEIALVSARRARLQVLVDRGERGAVAAMALHEEPTRFLSTVQVGITSIGIMSGIIGEVTLATPLREWLLGLGMEAETAAISATGLVVVIITYFAIVLGELLPKRLGQTAPEAIARRVALPITWLAVAALPFVRLLSGSTNLLLRVLGIRTSGAQTVTAEEIHALLVEGSEAGVIDEQERTMVRNVFRLDDRKVGSLMTPRLDIVYVDLNDPPREILRKVVESKHLRFPVCRAGLDEVVGVIDARQVLQQLARGETPNFAIGLQAPVVIPESLTAMELLEKFRGSSANMAVVFGEYGDIKGLVTPQDILEAIAGQFVTPTAEEAWAVLREDGSWLLDGLVPLPELKDRLKLDVVPDEDLGRYNTLAGMLMLLHGKIPREADVTVWQGWRFEIVDMDGNRIDKVLATQTLSTSETGRS